MTNQPNHNPKSAEASIVIDLWVEIQYRHDDPDSIPPVHIPVDREGVVP